MPEARDRLSRAEDVAAVYIHRRRSIISGGNGRGEVMTILADDPIDVGPTTPFRWGATPLTRPRGGIGVADASVGGGGTEWGSLGTPRIWRGTVLQMSPGTVIGRRSISRASTSRGSRGRGQRRGRHGGILPDWYLRMPLLDITETVRAIERRQDSLGEDDRPQLESPMPQEHAVLDPTVSTFGAQLKHDTSMSTPYQKIRIKPHLLSVGKVSKILLDITTQDTGESSALTPQKKLLNSIDTVEKVVMEELHKLKRTPMAKKADRERKVRTLMSMR